MIQMMIQPSQQPLHCRHSQLVLTAVTIMSLFVTGLSTRDAQEPYSVFGRAVVRDRGLPEMLRRDLMELSMSMSMSLSYRSAPSTPAAVTPQPTTFLLPLSAPTSFPSGAPTSAPITSSAATGAPSPTPITTTMPPSSSSSSLPPTSNPPKLSPANFPTNSPSLSLDPTTVAPSTRTATTVTACTPNANFASDPSSNITVSMEVDTIDPNATFLDDLSQGILALLADSFSVCLGNQQRVRRRLLHEQHRNHRELASATNITGLAIGDGTTVSKNETCQSGSANTSCQVVHVVVVVYTNDTDPVAAVQAVYNDLVVKLEAGGLLSGGNVAAVRVRDGRSNDSSHAEDGSNEDMASSGLSVEATTVTVFGAVTMAVFVAFGVSVYVQRHRQARIVEEDASTPDPELPDPETCDFSIVTAANTMTPTVATS